MFAARVCISGLSAVGKTHVAKSLADTLEAAYVSASTTMLEMAPSLSFATCPTETRPEVFWLTNLSKSFNDERVTRPHLDRLVDASVIKEVLAAPGRVVADSLTAPWLLPPTYWHFSVLLTADRSLRAARASAGYPTSHASMSDAVLEKDNYTRTILENTWGFNITSKEYLERFDMIINNGVLDDPNDIRRLEQYSKQTTRDIISTAVSLYRLSLGDSGGMAHTVDELKQRLALQMKAHPEAVCRIPSAFLCDNSVPVSANWRDHESVWINGNVPN